MHSKEICLDDIYLVGVLCCAVLTAPTSPHHHIPKVSSFVSLVPQQSTLATTHSLSPAPDRATPPEPLLSVAHLPSKSNDAIGNGTLTSQLVENPELDPAPVNLTELRKAGLTRACELSGTDPSTVVESCFEVWRRARHDVEPHLFPGVLDTLNALRERGVRYVLHSHCHRHCHHANFNPACLRLDWLVAVSLHFPLPFLACLAWEFRHN